ncbi:hypothetical protein CHS0354_012571 [Potamilus streckersoni]|uniref:Protein zwilch n=1 Tax=Potamilus streckersoni TaxID=2493646 RepID=A0AAE0SXB0_9BIVA|nr:hypothetical protein CHS0354_012571 [Potamilus streckersoni]
MDSERLSNFMSGLCELFEDKSSQIEMIDCVVTYLKYVDHLANKIVGKVMEMLDIQLPVILVHRPFIPDRLGYEESTFITSRRKNSSKSSCSESIVSTDVEGSPLKLQAIADISAFSSPPSSVCTQKHRTIRGYGISIDKCRLFVSMYCNVAQHIREQFRMQLPTMIALCDGIDLKNYVYLSAQPITHEGKSLVDFRLSSAMMMPSFKLQKSEHIKTPPSPISASDITCKATYNVSNGIQGEIIQAGYQGFLQVEFQWKKSGGHINMLQEPPLDARATVKAHVKSLGDMRSSAYQLYKELEIVKALMHGLETNEVHWIGMSDRPLLQEVQELVEQLKLGETNIDEKRSMEDSEDAEFNEAFDLTVDIKRKDFDFTDHLWKVLKNCTSHADLVESLGYVLTVLSNGELQPFIHSANKTTLADLVRDSFRGQLRIPALVGLVPLQMLAEIGMEKLRQDYINIFLQKNLTTLSHVEYFIQTKNKPKDKLLCLEKLQNVLEMVVMLKMFLNLPFESLGTGSRQMLKHYETHGLQDDHIFSFSVATGPLLKGLEGYYPKEWMIQGSKLVEQVVERKAYYMTTEQVFDWLSLQELEDEDCTQEEEPSYYLINVSDNINILS